MQPVQKWYYKEWRMTLIFLWNKKKKFNITFCLVNCILTGHLKVISHEKTQPKFHITFVFTAHETFWVNRFGACLWYYIPWLLRSKFEKPKPFFFKKKNLILDLQSHHWLLLSGICHGCFTFPLSVTPMPLGRHNWSTNRSAVCTAHTSHRRRTDVIGPEGDGSQLA